jgi:hypothetical protein
MGVAVSNGGMTDRTETTILLKRTNEINDVSRIIISIHVTYVEGPFYFE